MFNTRCCFKNTFLLNWTTRSCHTSGIKTEMSNSTTDPVASGPHLCAWLVASQISEGSNRCGGDFSLRFELGIYFWLFPWGSGVLVVWGIFLTRKGLDLDIQDQWNYIIVFVRSVVVYIFKKRNIQIIDGGSLYLMIGNRYR